MTKEKWFKLLKKEYSQIDQEWQWTYLLLVSIVFNEQIITKITITDHWREEHSDVMSNEKILEIVRKLNGEIIKPEPKKNPLDRMSLCPKALNIKTKNISLFSDSKKIVLIDFELGIVILIKSPFLIIHQPSQLPFSPQL